MAAIAFDTLKAARRLKKAGFPEAQAEAQAELMAEAFVFNMDAIVTRDYLHESLDARFATFENRINDRFSTFEFSQKERTHLFEASVDKRFTDLENRMDVRFDKSEASADKRFTEVGGQLRLHNWILAAVAASTVLPTLHQLFRG